MDDGGDMVEVWLVIDVACLTGEIPQILQEFSEKELCMSAFGATVCYLREVSLLFITIIYYYLFGYFIIIYLCCNYLFLMYYIITVLIIVLFLFIIYIFIVKT